MAVFFEKMRNEFLDKSRIGETFKGYEVEHKLEEDIKGWTYEDYDSRSVPPERQKIIEAYGERIMQAYIKNGLPSDEVKRRQEAHGPNKLPEKKRTSAIVKLLIEISNVFSLLLWFGAVLSLIGYLLAPSDMSNVRIL